MAGAPKIHLINPMWDSSGAEWRTYELYRTLSPHTTVHLWSTARPHAAFTALAPIRRLQPRRLQFPWGGTFVFVGVYTRIGNWIRLARPRRIILVYNTDDPTLLAKNIHQASRLRRVQPEVVFASQWLRASVNGTGPVQISPINIVRFAPPATPPSDRPFTVGRLSRDVAVKHHTEDPALYRRLADAGIQVRILGGTCLSTALSPRPEIELLPAQTIEPPDFLRTLDCFVYRTAPEFREPHGRVVQEAMACGLPVVCHHSGGYREYIEHGINGFLFDSNDEAVALIRSLQQDPVLRQRIGAAARATIEALFSEESRRQVVDYYLGPPAV